MTLRYALSQLSRPAARRAFGRAWLWVCLAGACVTLIAFGRAHLFFVATIWLVCVFAPVRIAVEVLHSRGPRLRGELRQALWGREDRYATVEHATLMVETLFAKEVHLPRLAPPDLREKVIESAARVAHHALRESAGPSAVLQAATTCAALLQRWAGAIAAGEAAIAPAAVLDASAAGNGVSSPALWNPTASIQDQWVTLRALAGLAALTKTLAAVYEDSTGAASQDGTALRTLSEAAMDYADQVGLRLDGPAWEDVPGVSARALEANRLHRLAGAWMTFCSGPLPAPRRLGAFVEVLTG